MIFRPGPRVFWVFAQPLNHVLTTLGNDADAQNLGNDHQYDEDNHND